jgi:hypothetical protein
MWRSVIERLASAWGRKAALLRTALGLCWYGLPRGRVTRPGGRFLLLHGDDAPIADWHPRVLARFRLDTHLVRFLYDEHERTFTQDRAAVFAEFGLPELSAHRRVGERRQ